MDNEKWVTINGTHIKLDENGEADFDSLEKDNGVDVKEVTDLFKYDGRYDYEDGVKYEDELESLYESSFDDFVKEEMDNIEHDAKLPNADDWMVELAKDKDELKKWAVDEVRYNEDTYKRRLKDELNEKIDKVYFKINDDIKQFIKDYSDILDGYHIECSIEKSRSIDAGENPSQYIKISVLTDEDDDEVSYNEYRLSDGHDNKGYGGDTKYTYLSFVDEYDKWLNRLKSNIVDNIDIDLS